MSTGNGTDLGHVVAMLGEVLAGQAEMRGEMNGVRGEMDGMRGELRSMRGEMRGMRETLEDHGRRLTGVERKVDDLSVGLATLRQTVVEYHSAVLGHGVLISDLDDRVRRIERHLNLPPVA